MASLFMEEAGDHEIEISAGCYFCVLVLLEGGYAAHLYSEEFSDFATDFDLVGQDG